MRVGLLLFLIGALTIVMVQNSTPALPLVIFGSSTIALPVGLWLLIGTAAGLVTSLLIQGLTFRPAPQVAPRYRERAERRRPEPKRQKLDWDQPPNSDWDAPPDLDDGWDIETPPERSTRPRPSRSKSTPEAEPEFEVERDRPRPKNGVYDADYRVIDPPQRDPRSTDSDGETWEF